MGAKPLEVEECMVAVISHCSWCWKVFWALLARLEEKLKEANRQTSARKLSYSNIYHLICAAGISRGALHFSAHTCDFMFAPTLL